MTCLLFFLEPSGPDLQQHTDSQMRLLVQEAQLDRMDLQWDLLGPSSLKAYCVFECEVSEQAVVVFLENAGSEMLSPIS